MDFITFKVIKGSKKAEEVEEWRNAIDPELALVHIQYLPETTLNQEMLPVMQVIMLGYPDKWYREEDFHKILVNYVKINWGNFGKK